MQIKIFRENLETIFPDTTVKVIGSESRPAFKIHTETLTATQFSKLAGLIQDEHSAEVVIKRSGKGLTLFIHP